MKTLSYIYLLILITTSACGTDKSDDKTEKPSTGAIGEIEDSSALGLADFLKEASYQNWKTKQPEPIDSVSAHSAKTRTYFNDTAATAAQQGQIPFPKGSILVKEIFEADATTLRGKALMAKAEDGTDGETWVWFEGFLPTYENPYYGKGLSTCTGCHQAGSDFVRTSVPSLL